MFKKRLRKAAPNNRSTFRNKVKQTKYNKIKEISPLFLKKPLDNRPYIQVKLYDQNISGLFDTGATSSIIGSAGMDLIKQWGIKFQKTKIKHIGTADGTQKIVLGVVDLPITIGNDFQIIKSLVVPSLPQSFIFGCDFAKQFKLQVNFSENVWNIKSESCSLNVSNTDSDFSEFNYSLCTLEQLSDFQKRIAEKIINSFKEIDGKNRLGRTDKIILSIDTGDAKPFRKRPYVMSPYMSQILNKELDEMLRLGVVEPSQSPWCSPVLLVKKRGGDYRLCFDGRPLNAITKHDSYPLPNVERILHSLRDAKFISSIDLKKAFWQVPLDPASKEKTAFSVIGRGQFQFVTMPFGLVNSAQTQQRLVDALFGPKYETKIFSYIDDILITGSSFQEHIELLEIVRDKLKEANLTVNFSKCEFFKTSLKYLGYIVGSNSLRTDPEKIASMVNYPRPRTTTEIKRFIGMCSWYRRFIKDFSTQVSPINDLLKGKKKNQVINWTEEAEKAFINIKQLLVSAPVLSQPDFSKKFTVQSDASQTGLGGVLTQIIDGEERVIAYASRSLTKSERNLSTTHRELLGVIFCIEKFRPYIEGVKFDIITDHYSLIWLNNLKNLTGKLARWSMKLRSHSFNLIHRKGSSNVVPDALSRIPCDEVSDEDIKSSNTDEYTQEIAYFEIDVDRIEPWYDNLRTKILNNPMAYPQFKVENNFIFKFVPSKLSLKNNLPEWKFVVPKPQREEVMKSCHDQPLCSHFGFYKTLSRIQEHFYWPKMRKDVMQFIRACQVCGAQKMPNTARMGLMGREKSVDWPFQIIGMDLIGPFPLSKRRNRWILVISDWFSKFTLLFPLRNAKATNIEKIVENDVFLMFGVPQFIICDNGAQFSGKTFKNLCKKYNVEKIWFNPVYSPHCNFVERNNRTIETAIRCYVEDHQDWDLELSKIRQAINTAKHEVTNFSPSFLVFGRHVPISGNFYKDVSDVSKDFTIIPGDRKSYAANVQHLSHIFSQVKKNLHLAYQKNCNQYNLRKRNYSFQVGEQVWRRNKVQSDAGKRFSAKLEPRYILSKIKRKISNLVYDLVNLDGSSVGKWHIKDLKPSHAYGEDYEFSHDETDSQSE